MHADTMPSYLLSTLAAQFRSTEWSLFRGAHGYSWLVWEPGPWRPPNRNQTEWMETQSTSPAEPRGKDGLAMPLQLVEGKTGLILGRENDTDLPINDATLSRNHLELSTGSSGWAVKDLGSRNGSWLNGRKLAPLGTFPLQNGAELKAGQVHLTYFEPLGLFQRLAQERR